MYAIRSYYEKAVLQEDATKAPAEETIASGAAASVPAKAPNSNVQVCSVDRLGVITSYSILYTRLYDTTEALAPLVREYDLDHGTSHIIISESGMNSPRDVRRVMEAGADAVLIGSALMESDSVFEKTKEFVQSFCWRE